MSLKSWLVRRRLLAELKVWQIKVDAERKKLDSATQEGRMPTWLHTVAVIFAGGAISALADALMAGSSLDAAGLKRAAVAGLVGGLIAVAAWLKQSPIQKPPAVALLLCLFAGSASADNWDVSAPNWTLVHVGAWACAFVYVCLLVCFLMDVVQGHARLREGAWLYGAAVLIALMASSGCASIETFPRRPLGVDQDTVEGLVCRAEIKQAEVYAQDRGASRAEVTERIQRAIEAAYRRPEVCCIVNGCDDRLKKSREESGQAPLLAEGK